MVVPVDRQKEGCWTVQEDLVLQPSACEDAFSESCYSDPRYVSAADGEG